MGCRSRKVHLGVFYEVIRPTFQERWNEVEERARGGKEPSAAAVIERYC